MGVNLSVRKRLKGIKWYFRGGQPYCWEGACRKYILWGHANRAVCPRSVLYHTSLPYGRIETLVDLSYVVIRQWFQCLNHLFDPDWQDYQGVDLDKTRGKIDGEKRYIWVAVDCDTLELPAVNISSS